MVGSNGQSGTRLKLDASKAMVSLDTSTAGATKSISNCQVSPTATTPSYLTGTGYLDATATTVSSCATAQTNTIRLFPTSFAKFGVVQIALESATASCSVSKSAPAAATAAYTASVRWKRPGDDNTYSPWLTLTGTQASDALASTDLTQAVDGSGLTLGDYISSWKSLINTELQAPPPTTTTAQASVPGAISIITQPTREDVAGGEGPHSVDPTSVVSLNIGTVSCKVSDDR